MALINRLDNSASVSFEGTSILSNTVSTLLSLPPTVAKAVDKLSASIGETLTYTVTITNVSLTALSDLPFTDTLPQGCAYLTDTFKVNDVSAVPTVAGSTLSYTIPSVPAAGSAVIPFRCRLQAAPFNCINRCAPCDCGHKRAIPARFTHFLHNRAQVRFQGRPLFSNTVIVRLEDRIFLLCPL